MSAGIPIRGFVAPGYEPVREAFTWNFCRKDGHQELGAALTAYSAGRCVVDLWGGFMDCDCSRPWQSETLVNVWSTTKGVTALAVALLVERGLLRYTQAVADVWPEFGVAGKENVTVAQIMAHRAGLPGFEEPTTLRDVYDWQRCCDRLALQRPVFEPGSASCYHTITYGILAGEVVRRVTGQTIGSFLARALAEPLTAEFLIGVPASRDAQIAELLPPERLSGPAADVSPAVSMAIGNPALDVASAATRAWRAAEVPAANGHGSARGIARLFAVLAGGGEFEGQRLFSPNVIAAMCRVYASGSDLLMGYDPQWCMGLYHNVNGMYGSDPRTVGHSGWGGSFGCANLQRRLAIGYVCNRMGSEMVGDERARSLARSFDSL